jgi:hypothetical protein
LLTRINVIDTLPSQPLQNVILTQTPPVPFLETLGARDTISVASPYTTSACMAKKVADGDAAAYVSNSADAAAHALQNANAQVEAIFSDPYGTSVWADSASASKLICASPSYETTPTGAAEWLKFFGYFFGADALAQTGFCATSARYSCNSLAASSISSESARLGSSSYSYQVPRVLFASLHWSGDFSIQMTPYKNKLVMDAGATYPDLSAYESFRQQHWTGAYTSGFQFPAANASSFHVRASSPRQRSLLRIFQLPGYAQTRVLTARPLPTRIPFAADFPSIHRRCWHSPT